MHELSSNELLNVNGGGISFGLVAGIATAVIFLIGVFHGFVNPEECNIKLKEE